MNKKFVQVKGLDLMYQGEKLQLKGVSLGGWLVLEDHMSGIPYIEHKIRERFDAILGENGQAFFKEWQESYIGEKDFEYLHSLGMNFIRLPFNYRMLEDGMNPGVYKEEGFKVFDYVIELAKKYDMFVLLDLHAAPGCQAVDWNVDCILPEALFWKEKDFQTRTINLWKEIAKRYKNEPTVMGYELLGEPVAPSPMNQDDKLVQDFYHDIVPALRKVDPNHIFVLVANGWGKNTASLTDDVFALDAQMIPSPHYYPYESIPYSDLVEYPCDFANREILKENIDIRADVARIQRPTLFAEFGIGYNSVATEEIFKLTEEQLDIFNSEGFHWAIWCYKDIGSFGFVNPEENSPWMKFINREDVKEEAEKLKDLCWVNYHADAKVQSVFFDGVRKIFPDLDFEYTQHRVREARRNVELLLLDSFLMKLKEYSKEEIIEMAKSFSFDNCKINKRAEKMLKKFLE